MSYVPWDSQPLEECRQAHAAGRIVDLGGRSTHVIDTGSGEAVILIHGFFYDTFTWHNNIEALSATLRVIAVDLWGFGYSTRDPMDYGYPLFAEQLLLLIDHLGVQKASIVGHSMGGGTAIYFARHHPERVDKLLLVDAAGMPHPLPPLGRITNLPGLGECMYGIPGNFMRRLALNTNWIYHKRYVTDEYLENATRFHKVEGTNAVLLTIQRKAFFHTLADDIAALGKLNIPTLIVWGKHDAAIPLSCGRALHAALPGSRLEVIDDVAHCPHDESASQFNPLARSFLSD